MISVTVETAQPAEDPPACEVMHPSKRWVCTRERGHGKAGDDLSACFHVAHVSVAAIHRSEGGIREVNGSAIIAIWLEET